MYSYHTNIKLRRKRFKIYNNNKIIININNNNKKINTGRGSPLTNLLVSIHLTCS